MFFSRSSARLGRCDSSNAPASDADDVGHVLEDLGEGRPMSVGARLQAQHAVGDLVHDRDPAVPVTATTPFRRFQTRSR